MKQWCALYVFLYSYWLNLGLHNLNYDPQIRLFISINRIIIQWLIILAMVIHYWIVPFLDIWGCIIRCQFSTNISFWYGYGEIHNWIKHSWPKVMAVFSNMKINRLGLLDFYDIKQVHQLRICFGVLKIWYKSVTYFWHHICLNLSGRDIEDSSFTLSDRLAL